MIVRITIVTKTNKAMGWTSQPMRESVKQWFTELWNKDTHEVLDVAIVKRNTLYAAIRLKTGVSANQVFCIVFLLRWSRGYYNFSYKDMSEFSGPNEIECPKRIMKLLTPLDDNSDPNGWARGWRDKVNTYWNVQEKLNSGKYLVKTNEPVNFTNGLSFSYFKKMGKHFIAGALQANNIFASYCEVRFNPLHYKYELIERL